MTTRCFSLFSSPKPIEQSLQPPCFGKADDLYNLQVAKESAPEHELTVVQTFADYEAFLKSGNRSVVVLEKEMTELHMVLLKHAVGNNGHLILAVHPRQNKSWKFRRQIRKLVSYVFVRVEIIKDENGSKKTMGGRIISDWQPQLAS